MMYGLKPFNGAEMRSYLDIVEATSTPRINGFQQTTDDDGTVTSDYSVGPVSASTTQRPNTINTSSATVPLAHNVQLTVDKGIGFGGAGKDVTPGGNQVSTITARTAQNPEGTTSSFVGKPTAQDLEKAVPADWDSSGNEFSEVNEDFPGTHGAWMHGGFKVTYDPSTQTVRVQGKNQERSHKFTNAPTDRSYHDRVQQIIDQLEDESELRENPSLVMREWMALCR
jgi:hypothetical protein